jgi:hypothetical protein
MAGQAALLSRETVRADIKAAECNNNTKGSTAPKMPMKTVKKQ